MSPAHSTTQTKPERDLPLEGLRALAALMVLYSHVVISKRFPTTPIGALDPGYAPPSYLDFTQTGSQAVLLFFILSGYVIGLTNPEGIANKSVTGYLKRRASRLLPIYIPAVIMGFLLTPVTLAQLAGNFLFLQNICPDNPFGVTLIQGNSNLWSLHYEVLYYLLFIPIWLHRPRLSVLFGVTLLLACLGLAEPSFTYWMPRLAMGFLFWLAGLAIAWKLPQDPGNTPGPWPSAMLLCVAIWKMGIMESVVKRLAGIGFEFYVGPTLYNLDSMIPMLWLFLIITRRLTCLAKVLEAASWGWFISYLGWRLCLGHMQWEPIECLATGLFLAAALLRFWKPSLGFFRKLAPLGAISYAVYCFGFPIQMGLRKVGLEFSGSIFTWSVRALVTIAFTLFLSWLVERKLWPYLRTRGRQTMSPALT